MVRAVAYSIEFTVRKIADGIVYTTDNAVLDLKEIERFRFTDEPDELKMKIFDLWIDAKRNPKTVSHDWRTQGF